ncbi:MAG: glycosyltransferase family 2 protein [Candidatus Acidiferrales bacterium]
MPALSAILIARNEQVDLPRALQSLEGVVDEIILVDAGSTDRTVEIARSGGARIFERPFSSFADQKNYAAAQATNDWVFSIDCDEALTPELRASLLAWKTEFPVQHGYEISRLTNYLGGWIRHSGWYPDRIVRLYDRTHGQFAGTIHESVRLDGPAGRLKGLLHHYNVRTYQEHLAKIDAFTNIAAAELYQRGRKHWRVKMYVAAPWTFFQRLMLRLGFLDGRRGWMIAWTSARYVRLKYAKLGALVRANGERAPAPGPAAKTS